jgi:hypothetical protein
MNITFVQTQLYVRLSNIKQIQLIHKRRGVANYSSCRVHGISDGAKIESGRTEIESVIPEGQEESVRVPRLLFEGLTFNM